MVENTAKKKLYKNFCILNFENFWMATNRGNKILIVGNCCVDEVLYVKKFPLEDTDNRVFNREIRLGGNAANIATVLTQLKSKYELFSSIPLNYDRLEEVLKKCGIESSVSIRRKEIVDYPITTAIINMETGTRTILHYRGNLPELSANEFRQVFDREKLNDYGWIHFEGRNFDEVRKMLVYVREIRGTTTKYPRLSVELEKIRAYPALEQLIPLADLVFVSKDFSRNKNWNSMEEAINGIQIENESPNTVVIVPWGEQGASGRESLNSEIIHQKCLTTISNAKILDTLGAGDCFIGAALHFLNNESKSLNEVIKFATQIATDKCTQNGLLNLKIKHLI